MLRGLLGAARLLHQLLDRSAGLQPGVLGLLGGHLPVLVAQLPAPLPWRCGLPLTRTPLAATRLPARRLPLPAHRLLLATRCLHPASLATTLLTPPTTCCCPIRQPGGVRPMRD